MPEQPWYKNGLRFKCTACGDCCTGAPGYVWVNGGDVAAMAAMLEMAVDEFEERYVRQVGVRRSLVELDNGDCVFFDNRTRKCRVYSARPRQCRTWPFWPSNLATREAWADTCRACPGSGTGRLYQLEEIQKQAAVVRV
jgi:Fe-S-cluster containining protein